MRKASGNALRCTRSRKLSSTCVLKRPRLAETSKNWITLLVVLPVSDRLTIAHLQEACDASTHKASLATPNSRELCTAITM